MAEQRAEYMLIQICEFLKYSRKYTKPEKLPMVTESKEMAICCKVEGFGGGRKSHPDTV